MAKKNLRATEENFVRQKMKELFQNKGSAQTLSVCFKCVLPATRGAFLVLQEPLEKAWGFKYPQKPQVAAVLKRVM